MFIIPLTCFHLDLSVLNSASDSMIVLRPFYILLNMSFIYNEQQPCIQQNTIWVTCICTKRPGMRCSRMTNIPKLLLNRQCLFKLK